MDKRGVITEKIGVTARTAATGSTQSGAGDGSEISDAKLTFAPADRAPRPIGDRPRRTV